jgi:hypothetical protein
MKRITASAAFLLLLAWTIVAMTVSPKVLVEVNAYDAAQKLDFSGVNTYLRVYDGGRIEYADKKNNEGGIIHRETKLSSSQLKSLAGFLARPEVMRLGSGQYPSYPPNLNFATSIDISIARDSERQVVGTHNFKLPLGGVRDNKLPQALVELICYVESLREGATYRVTPKEYCHR